MTLITLHEASEAYLPFMIDSKQVVGIRRKCWDNNPVSTSEFIIETTTNNYEVNWSSVVKLVKGSDIPTVQLQSFYERDFETAVSNGVYDNCKFSREQAINNARGIVEYLTDGRNHLMEITYDGKRRPVYFTLSHAISQGENLFQWLPSTMDSLIEIIPETKQLNDWAWNDSVTESLLQLCDERCEKKHFSGFDIEEDRKHHDSTLRWFKERIESHIKQKSKKGSDSK